MRWAAEIDAPAITRVVLAEATSLIITLVIETRAAQVVNSLREPLLTTTIRVAQGATPTHIREETTTFLAQITTEEEITTVEMVAIDHLTEATVEVPLMAAPAEVLPQITEATSLDMMTDAGMRDLDMIETINQLRETTAS